VNTGIGKLSTLLDDPEVRDLIFGLAHVRSAPATAEPGAPRLRAVVLELAGATTVEQYRSWLSDDGPNVAMTVDQVRVAIGDGALSDLADFTSSSPDAVAWQLAFVLPDLVDAVSPGGQIVDAPVLAEELATAGTDDERSAGAFGDEGY
jgi:uncharacterized protein YidB (DUF937 family)